MRISRFGGFQDRFQNFKDLNCHTILLGSAAALRIDFQDYEDFKIDSEDFIQGSPPKIDFQDYEDFIQGFENRF